MTDGRLAVSLLGPMRVTSASAELPLGTPQQRGLLALLALRGAAVTVDEAVTALWGAEPPASARGTVRTYIARLRQTLTVDGRAVVRRAGTGYLLDADLVTVDTSLFRQLVEEARSTGTALPRSRWRSCVALSVCGPVPRSAASAVSSPQRSAPGSAKPGAVPGSCCSISSSTSAGTGRWPPRSRPCWPTIPWTAASRNC